MRLTCPRCSAQYEIPDQVITGSGREVECSACSHVWHQRGPEPAQIRKNSGEITPIEANYDATARPSLNRPLHDSILSILREETARELSARQPATQDAPQAPDHIHATDAATAAPAAVEPPQITPPTTPQDRPEIEWPVATVILPGEPIAADAPPPEPVPEPAPKPAPKPAPEPIPVAPTLPDAAQLAATLTRTTPSAPQTGPISAKANSDAAFPVETLTEPDPLDIGHTSNMRHAGDAITAPLPEAPVPVIIPKPPRGSYVMGFGLAVMASLALLAFYALAPRIAPDAPSSVISTAREELDQGRLWLNDKARALKGHLMGY